MRRSMLALLGLVVMHIGSGLEAKAQDGLRQRYPAMVDLLQRAIEYENYRGLLPALSIALVDDQRVVWSAGFGQAGATDDRRATADTIYRVGSVSKLFTDLAVMQLVEQKKLDLDAPVTDYLPGFAPHNPHGIPNTLRQLMSHRSGLVREPPVGHYFDPTEPSLRATVASLNQTALVYPPLSKIKYSNAAIAVVGLVLEEQTGKPYDRQIAETIFAPLGMASSSFTLTPDVEAQLKWGKMWTYDDRPRFVAPTFALGTAPAGNMYSSVNDLAKFLCCLFREGRTAAGALIGAAALHEMMTPVVDAQGQPQGFGLGFQVDELDGHKRVGHGGAVYGYSTQLEALPEQKLGVVAVLSLDGANGIVRRLTDYALRLMLAQKQGKKLPEYRATSLVPAERAQELIGVYQAPHGPAVVSLSNGRMFDGRLTLERGVFRREIRADGKDGGLLIDDTFGLGESVRLDEQGNLVLGETVCPRLPDEPPAPAPEHWLGLIGEYGWDHNTLYILEDHGRLVALIEWFYRYPLTEIDENEFAFPEYGLYHGERLKFRRDEAGRATEVVAAEVRFERRAVGTAEGETFRIAPLRPIDELRGEALAAAPPQETKEFRPSELVELTDLDPTIRLDIRYATTNNFTGAVFYKQPRAFLQRPAAEAVVRAHKRLQQRGLGLLIHDAYRPWHVTKMFWDATPDEMKNFVANPAQGSRHNRGCAVDLTLYELETGRPVPMVAGYDEFSPRSYPRYPGGTSRQRYYRELLRRTMEAEGFTVYEFEWWHFDYQDWQEYAVGNRPFEELD